MKALLPILILVAVVFGIFYFSKNKQSSPVQNVNLPEITGEEISREFEGTFAFDVNESKIKWTGGKKIIVDYIDTGSVNLKSGFVTLDSGNISAGEIIIDMNSIATLTTGKGDGQDGLTRHLKSADFFEVDKNPEAKFVVTSSEKTSSGFLLKGNLTLKGKTNPLEIPVNLKTENGNVLLAGIAEVNRSLWDVKFGSESFFDNLGDNVIKDIFTLEFTLVAKP